MLEKVMTAFRKPREVSEVASETVVQFNRRADDKSDEDAHKKRAQGRKEALKKAFPDTEMLKALEEASRNWPESSKGFPLSGYRSRLMAVMGMDAHDPDAHDLCDLWHDSVGHYFVGTESFVGDDGIIWGPSPVPGVEELFPYSQADYIRARDEWRIRDENHPLFNTFHGKSLRVG